MPRKQRYNVLSPDGISIEFDKTYCSPEEAKQAFDLWAKRYEKQGYYSSNEGRIPLADLEYYCTLVEL